jgi:hypothetical protein
MGLRLVQASPERTTGIIEKGIIEIKKLNENNNEKRNKIMELLPLLLDVPALFEMAGIEDQHTLVREVFKHGITYSEGRCRTPSINPASAHNALKTKEKGLLFFEQSLLDLSANPMCPVLNWNIRN